MSLYVSFCRAVRAPVCSGDRILHADSSVLINGPLLQNRNRLMAFRLPMSVKAARMSLIENDDHYMGIL